MEDGSEYRRDTSEEMEKENGLGVGAWRCRCRVATVATPAHICKRIEEDIKRNDMHARRTIDTTAARPD